MSDEMTSLISLTRDLIAFNTVNPPGNEGPCARYLANMLEAAGFEVVLLPFEPDRPNLIARSGTTNRPPLCFPVTWTRCPWDRPGGNGIRWAALSPATAYTGVGPAI